MLTKNLSVLHWMRYAFDGTVIKIARKTANVRRNRLLDVIAWPANPILTAQTVRKLAVLSFNPNNFRAKKKSCAERPLIHRTPAKWVEVDGATPRYHSPCAIPIGRRIFHANQSLAGVLFSRRPASESKNTQCVKQKRNQSRLV